MPGSPPIRIREPGTIPPPNTLSISAIPDEILPGSSPTSPAKCSTVISAPEVSVLLFTWVSTRLPQVSQSGHLPIHFLLSYPHWLQRKSVLLLLFFCIFLIPFRIARAYVVPKGFEVLNSSFLLNLGTTA